MPGHQVQSVCLQNSVCWSISLHRSSFLFPFNMLKPKQNSRHFAENIFMPLAEWSLRGHTGFTLSVWPSGRPPPVRLWTELYEDKFGISRPFLKISWEEWAEIWHADVSWPRSELIRFWSSSVDFPHFTMCSVVPWALNFISWYSQNRVNFEMPNVHSQSF